MGENALSAVSGACILRSRLCRRPCTCWSSDTLPHAPNVAQAASMNGPCRPLCSSKLLQLLLVVSLGLSTAADGEDPTVRWRHLEAAVAAAFTPFTEGRDPDVRPASTPCKSRQRQHGGRMLLGSSGWHLQGVSAGRCRRVPVFWPAPCVVLSRSGTCACGRLDMRSLSLLSYA